MAGLFSVLLGLDTWQKIGLLVAIFLTAVFTIRQKFTIHYPANLPRVRENGRTRFSLKTRLAYYTDCQNLFREIYDNVRLST